MRASTEDLLRVERRPASPGSYGRQTSTSLTFREASHPATLAQCCGSRRSHDLIAWMGTTTYGSLSRSTASTMRARSLREFRRSLRSSSAIAARCPSEVIEGLLLVGRCSASTGPVLPEQARCRYCARATVVLRSHA